MTDLVKFGLYITYDMRRDLRIYCAQHDRSVSDLIREILEDWMQSQKVNGLGDK